MAGALATPTAPNSKTLRGEHNAAQADVVAAVERERTADALWGKYARLTRSDGVLPSEEATGFELAEARLGEPTAREELLRAQIDVARAKARAQETAAAVVDAEDAEKETRLRAKVSALLALLHQARPLADEMAVLVQAHSRLRTSGLQFPSVQSSNDRWESPLDAFERALRDTGLL